MDWVDAAAAIARGAHARGHRHPGRGARPRTAQRRGEAGRLTGRALRHRRRRQSRGDGRRPGARDARRGRGRAPAAHAHAQRQGHDRIRRPMLRRRSHHAARTGPCRPVRRDLRPRPCRSGACPHPRPAGDGAAPHRRPSEMLASRPRGRAGLDRRARRRGRHGATAPRTGARGRHRRPARRHARADHDARPRRRPRHHRPGAPPRRSRVDRTDRVGIEVGALPGEAHRTRARPRRILRG